MVACYFAADAFYHGGTCALVARSALWGHYGVLVASRSGTICGEPEPFCGNRPTIYEGREGHACTLGPYEKIGGYGAVSILP
jgi:hypothetical protein